MRDCLKSESFIEREEKLLTLARKGNTVAAARLQQNFSVKAMRMTEAFLSTRPRGIISREDAWDEAMDAVWNSIIGFRNGSVDSLGLAVESAIDKALHDAWLLSSEIRRCEKRAMAA